MLARPHPCLGWLYLSPADTRRVLDRLLHYRDLELAENPNFTGMPQAFIDWTWVGWLPSNLHRYDEQVRQQIAYLDSKIGRLDQDLTHLAGGVLDARDDAVDLRERLQRQLDAWELAR